MQCFICMNVNLSFFVCHPVFINRQKGHWSVTCSKPLYILFSMPVQLSFTPPLHVVVQLCYNCTWWDHPILFATFVLPSLDIFSRFVFRLFPPPVPPFFLFPRANEIRIVMPPVPPSWWSTHHDMPNSMDILHTVTFVQIREFLSNHARLNAIKQTFFLFEHRGIRMIGGKW